jgi:hypothetical protein
MNDPNAPQCIYCGNPLAAPQPQAYGQPQAQPYGAPPPAYGQQPPPAYGAPPPAYGAPPPGYGAPPPGYGAPPPGYVMEQPMISSAQARTSGMAVAGLICSILCSFVGLILSIIALVQINKSMGMLRGRGLAIAGIIISIVFMVIGASFQACNRGSYRRSYRYYRYGELEQQKHRQPLTALAQDQAQLERLAAASRAVAL